MRVPRDLVVWQRTRQANDGDLVLPSVIGALEMALFVPLTTVSLGSHRRYGNVGEVCGEKGSCHLHVEHLRGALRRGTAGTWSRYFHRY
jgi:hypothetical protein